MKTVRDALLKPRTQVKWETFSNTDNNRRKIHTFMSSEGATTSWYKHGSYILPECGYVNIFGRI